MLGLAFETQASQTDESVHMGEEPLAYVTRVAAEKGKACSRTADAWVLSADTIVAQDGRLIGKPSNYAEAEEILKSLRGRDHQVLTALSLTKNGNSHMAHCQTRVSMRPYNDDEIEAYIQTNSPMDKAGGYAIQDIDFHPVSGLQGCWANVMGLPLCHLYKLMLKSGLEPEPGIAKHCQDYLGITCPVFAEILNEA